MSVYETSTCSQIADRYLTVLALRPSPRAIMDGAPTSGDDTASEDENSPTSPRAPAVHSSEVVEVVKIPDFVALASGRVCLNKPKFSTKQSWCVAPLCFKMHKAKQINHSFFVYLFDRTWAHFRKIAGRENSVFCFRCYEKEKALAEKADRDMDEAVFIFLAANSSKGCLENHMKRHHNDIHVGRMGKQAAGHIANGGTIEAFCNLKSKFEEKALLWTVMSYQPFNTFDCEFFRGMCESLYSNIRHISGDRMRCNVTRAAAFVRGLHRSILHVPLPHNLLFNFGGP